MDCPLTITDPNDLNKIMDAIHDYWFDLDGIGFDSGTSTLRVPFSKSYDKGWKKFVPRKGGKQKYRAEFVLEIKHVKRYEINDTEKVGIYDFNEITYDGKTKLTVTTGIPLGFTVYISRLEIAVREAD